MSFLPPEFDDFIAPNASRATFICDYLEKRGVKTSVIALDGKKHIFVHFPQSAYSPLFKLKTVLCHYDRVENSPGANDNSAACFQIMNWAVRLSKFQGVHNVRIFFTDGEEISGQTSVKSQGAYSLATIYRRLGITKDDVYVFDSTGRGEIAVLPAQNTTFTIKGNLSRLYSDLFLRTQNLLRSVCPNQWFTLPLPYSDNASFLACGIPAIAITLLPQDEVSLFAKNLMEDPQLSSSILNPERRGEDYFKRLPLTWRLFHTPHDSKESLCEASFSLMARLLDSLALSRSPAR